ncbi:hypothetical protein [Luteolibacter sp. Populi]|uniref:hypothetical protein n=1 Tax=Luteolibacter sp. Populi TaxID=3230487 RepID=UPI0034674379
MADLSDRWKVPSSVIGQWLTGGDLTALVWLPIMSVVELQGDSMEAESHSLCHWEGYIHISAHQCRRLFRQEWIALREFFSQDRRRRLRLPEAADDLIVELHDLVILEAERRRFETAYPALTGAPLSSAGSQPQPPQAPAPAIDPTFRVVQLDGGREVRFGETQAKVLRLLADAARQGEPWQSGKVLLGGAGSQSLSISNLFKRHPAWRELIVSNGRGFYRLEHQFVELTRGRAVGS